MRPFCWCASLVHTRLSCKVVGEPVKWSLVRGVTRKAVRQFANLQGPTFVDWIEIELNELDEKKAYSTVEDMCKKLLVNLIIEEYKIKKI